MCYYESNHPSTILRHRPLRWTSYRGVDSNHSSPSICTRKITQVYVSQWMWGRHTKTKKTDRWWCFGVFLSCIIQKKSWYSNDPHMIELMEGRSRVRVLKRVMVWFDLRFPTSFRWCSASRCVLAFRGVHFRLLMNKILQTSWYGNASKYPIHSIHSVSIPTGEPNFGTINSMRGFNIPQWCTWYTISTVIKCIFITYKF